MFSGIFTSYWPPPKTCEAAEEDIAEACGAAEANPEEELEPSFEKTSHRAAAASIHPRDHPEAKWVKAARKRHCEPPLISPHLLLQVGQVSHFFQSSLPPLSTTVSPARPPAALPSLVEDTEFADVVNGISNRPLLPVRNVGLMSSGIR